jgi:conjugal transfer pilus assembly protein TrbC
VRAPDAAASANPQGTKRRLRATVRSVALFGSLALVSAAIAQTVEGLDLGAIRKRAAEEQKDADTFVQSVMERAKPFEPESQDLRASAMERVALISPADLPKGPDGPVDFDALIAGAASNQAEFEASGPLFIVFASLSIPKGALAQLIADTSTAGGVVAFRGFPGNEAKAFVAGMKGVLTAPEQQAHIAIDPRLFRAFAVQAAPTFVVVSSDFALCEGLKCETALPTHDRMTGNVTVKYALESFADGQGPGASIARTALARLRKAQP